MKALPTLLTLASLTLLSAQVRAAVPVSGCGTSERNSIETIHADLERKLVELNDPAHGISRFSYPRIRDSIVVPEGRIPSPRYTQHAALYQNFHNKTVAVLRRMNEKVESGYSYACTSSWDAVCRGGAYAYVKFFFGRPTNRITFCPSFWELGADERLRTTFHELSHLAALTTDDLGNIFTNAGMLSQTDEAYFYESMMNDDLAQFLKIRSWGLLWTKPKPAPAPTPKSGSPGKPRRR